MKTALKLIATAVMLLALLFLVPSVASVGRAEVIEIPLEAKPDDIPLPQEGSYLSSTEYEDPSISVSITTGTMYDTGYMIAHVKIANASQIRSAMSGNYGANQEILGYKLAKKYHAVLAVNGDFFTMTPNKGITIRQGNGYYLPKDDKNLTNNNSHYDLLLIDDKGDLHILKQATMDDLYNLPEDMDVINTFTFGPALVIDGERQGDFRNFTYAVKISPEKGTQRMCIAQVGPLEYLCICCEGPDDPGSVGMTLDQFTDLVCAQEGVINAYNLDGGGSSTMVFHNKKVNCPNRNVNRSLVDILYFASAYMPE